MLMSQGVHSPTVFIWGVKSRKCSAAPVPGAHRAHFCADGESTQQGRTEMAGPVFVQAELGSPFMMHRAAVETAEINLNYLCCLGS